MKHTNVHTPLALNTLKGHPLMLKELNRCLTGYSDTKFCQRFPLNEQLNQTVWCNWLHVRCKSQYKHKGLFQRNWWCSCPCQEFLMSCFPSYFSLLSRSSLNAQGVNLKLNCGEQDFSAAIISIPTPPANTPDESLPPSPVPIPGILRNTRATTFTHETVKISSL